MDQKDLEAIFERSLTPDTSPAGVPMPGIDVQEIDVMGSDPTNEELVMSDAQIDSILQRRIQNATNWMGSQISTAQAKAMQYYLGLPEGDLAPPGIQGRSSIVDTTVSDQIEWLMPQLMEIFFASGNIVRFSPRKPGDEDGAAQMTKLVNYIINDVNPGFQFFMEWFKNSLLNKVGVAKVWWEQYDETERSECSDLTDEQLAIIADDPEVQITRIVSYTDPNAYRQTIEGYQNAVNQYHAALNQFMQQGGQLPMGQVAPGQLPPPPAAHPNAAAAAMQGAQGQPQPPQPPQKPDMSKLPQLHNVVMLRSRKAGRVAISAMNPEDFLIDERSRRIDDGFCAHRLVRTISELRAAGYENVDDIDLDQLSSDQQAETVQNSEVMYARESLQTVYKPQEVEDYGDESQRKVFLYECYLKIDCDGDGFAEWRKITRAGNALLENIVCDGPPFAALCPVPIPGLFYGRSVAELGMPMQLAKTGVLRALVDNMNVQVNGRTWAVENQVNIDDLLTNRPGGVVRVKTPNAVGVLAQGMADSQGAYQLLEYLDAASQERSGITKYSQGTDSDMLNPTATAYKGITQRADLRTKLIARTFAETGVKELVRLIQKVLMRHQDQRMVFELEGKWVNVDPQVWHNQYNMRVRVGLGTGEMGEKVQMLQQFMQVMGMLMQSQLGIVTPQNMYNAAKELAESMQIGQADQFVTPPPPPNPNPPPPPPDPAMVAVQAQAQLEQAKFEHQKQMDQLKMQNEQQLSAQKAAQQREQTMLHEQLLHQRETDQFAQQQAWEKEKFYLQLAANRTAAAEKAGVDANTEIALNNAILQDAEGNKYVVPHTMLATMRQQDIDSQHRHLDRQQANAHHAQQLAAQQQNADAERQQSQQE